MLIGFWHETIFTEVWETRIIYLFTLYWRKVASFECSGGGRDTTGGRVKRR